MRRSLTLPALLLALCVLLCGCSPVDPMTSVASQPGDSTGVVPAPAAGDDLYDHESATLWFRFGVEPYLAPETRTLTLSPTEPYEFTLLQALCSGPAAASTELGDMFPAGTRVLSTYRQGRLLFVTLSRHIMNAYADEPSSWQQLADWAEEVPLRRKLAMQSIAATVTENCDVDEVIILVEQGSQATDSMRLRESYYMTGSDASTLAAPLQRSDELLLTPHKTMDVVLQCWSERNWLQLYRYVAPVDPVTGEERPDYVTFALKMNALPHLTAYVYTGGSMVRRGQGAAQATFTLYARLLSSGSVRELSGSVLRLDSSGSVWRIGMSQLSGRWEGTP